MYKAFCQTQSRGHLLTTERKVIDFLTLKKGRVQQQQSPRSFIFKGKSFYHTIVRSHYLSSHNHPSYHHTTEICFSALNLKKRPCTTAKVPKVRHFKETRHTIVPMRNLRSYNLTSEVDSDFEKKALYNGNSARGQPFSRAPSYTIFKGHRFEGRH